MRPSGVDRELGGAAAGPEAAGDERAAPGGGGRAPGPLGGLGAGLSRGRRATLLEPPDPQRSGSGAKEGPDSDPGLAAADHVRRDPGASGRTEREVQRLV